MDRFSSKNTDSEWLPISDLMSVLMMVFLIISVSYMLQVEKAENERKKITEDYINTQEELYKWDELGLIIVPKDLDKVPFKSDLIELFQNKLFFRGYKKLYIYQYNSYRIYNEILVLTNELLDKLNNAELVKKND